MADDSKAPSSSQDNRKNVAVLSLPDGRELEFPVEHDTIGDAISVNVKGAFAKAKVFFSSPGYADLSAARSQLTYIDGDNGILLYRGYPIEQLANSATFMEVCYLILNGELPNKEQLTSFEKEVVKRMPLHDQMMSTLHSLPRSTHPMATMSILTTSLSAYLGDKIDTKTKEGRYEIALQLIAKSATIGAIAKRYSLGEAIVNPSDRLNYVDNFLRMTFANAAGEYDKKRRIEPCNGPQPYLACRARTKRIDFNGSSCRFIRHKPVRIDCGGYCNAVGSFAWRRERSGS